MVPKKYNAVIGRTHPRKTAANGVPTFMYELNSAVQWEASSIGT